MQKVSFERYADNLLAQANDEGLYIIHGWTVPVPKDRAIEYVKNYNCSANKGFFEHNGQVIFTHDSAKITLTTEEAQAIIALINAAYLG